ncbi:hypothetical protein [uncultured Pelagimonas sp.]|uniref:hypothetical protein n=1 Tax=uncultured Pelagimonas sp. TaxID=1618102 RepID=UPI00260BDE53|nr:hypothetical protein [uncultured Pelagimonas sp.]
MAAWQFPVMLIPAKAMLSEPQLRLQDFLTDDGWDVVELWSEGPNVARAGAAVSEFLGNSTSLNGWDQAFYWGTRTGNDASLHFDGAKVENLSFRLDMRSFDEGFVRSIVSIAFNLQCHTLIMERGIAVAPTIDGLKRQAEKSRAARCAEVS